MKRTKAAFVSGAVSVLSLASSITAFAAGNAVSSNGVSLENGYLRLTVEQKKSSGTYLQYHLDTTGGRTAVTRDDNKNLTYSNYCSAYTTINVNGKNYIYGLGEDVDTPAYNESGKCHVSSQRFGDVVIEQRLSFAEGYTPGCEDMLRISYKVREAGADDYIGARILLDPQIERDDELKVSASGVVIGNETVFNKNDIPCDWKAQFVSGEDAAAYGKTSGADPAPDQLIFADWTGIYDNKWDYSPDITKPLSDSAAAVLWNPASNMSGREFVTYYGIRNSGEINDGSDPNAAKVASPKTGRALPVLAWSLLGVSAATAAGCLKLRRKGDENNG